MHYNAFHLKAGIHTPLSIITSSICYCSAVSGHLSGFHGWLPESYCIAVAVHMPIGIPPVCAQDPLDDMIMSFVLLRTLYSVSSPELKHCRNIGHHKSLHR